MSVKFKTLRYKNILSTGNTFTEINLCKNGLTMISGSNGAGKCVRGSTEIDISFDDAETRKIFEEFMKKN